MAFGRFRSSLRRSRKNINRRLCSVSAIEKSYIAKDVYIQTLLNKGVVRLQNEIDKQLLDKWKQDYSIYQSSFLPVTGNITFPIFCKELHELLVDSHISNLIDKYFQYVYRKKPILQYVPHVVITYPTIAQDEFNSNENHFPAVWHIDYPYEFTIHIPIERITLDTSHTKYINGSQYYFSRPSNNIKYIERNYNIINCVANQGDILCMDVEGWHRAHLEKNSYRAMIAIKFTAGNDLLYYTDSEKEKNVIERSKNSCNKYNILRDRLTNDLRYIESLNDLGDKFGILKDTANRYKRYIDFEAIG